MRSKYVMRTVTGILAAATMLWPQAVQTTAIRAGKLFDPKSGRMLANQLVLIEGERITSVGPAASVSIPAGAKVFDLSRATVLPGLIDGHVRLTDAVGGLQQQMMAALHSATESLQASYTILVVQGSHGGGFAGVELKRAAASRYAQFHCRIA
jgi:imidazolonepropionase-like amidohydrolase